MPAKSEAQRRLMGMALSVKRGQQEMKDIPEGVRPTVKGLLRSMSDKQLREFAMSRNDHPKKQYVGVRTR